MSKSNRPPGAEGRPEWEVTGADPGPVLENLHPLARAQVVNVINIQIIAELVDMAGGQVRIPPGFKDRMSDPRVVGTRFAGDADDPGEYIVWTEDLTPERDHPGKGTRWERVEGPKREGRVELYEVVTYSGGEFTGLAPITSTGERINTKPIVNARTEYLRRGIGWKRWTPPPEVIEHLGGRE